jgi:presenilin-like A22 family membrane protease
MNIKIKETTLLFLTESFLFSLTLFLGIFCAVRTQKFFNVQKIESSSVSFSQFIFYFFLATLFVLSVFYFVRRKPVKVKIYRFLFIFASFFSSLIFFESFLPEPISLILVFLLIFWWIKKPIVLNQNLLIILSLAGIGASTGLILKPEAVILILVVLSIYDFIAVYKTKHMVKIAKDMIESGTILGLVFPFEFSGFLKSTREIKPGEGKFLILGGGDVALPLIFSVSLLKFGIFKSFFVAFFSLFGLFSNFLLFLLQKKREGIPALPLISLFSILGYLLLRVYWVK